VNYIRVYVTFVVLYALLFSGSVLVLLNYEEHYSGTDEDYYRFDDLDALTRAAVVIHYVIRFPLGLFFGWGGQQAEVLFLFLPNSLIVTTIVLLLARGIRRMYR